VDSGGGDGALLAVLESRSLADAAMFTNVRIAIVWIFGQRK